MKAIFLDGERPLEQVSPDEIDWLRSADASAASSVFRYALDGTDLLLLYPAPSESASLQLRVVKRPTEMSLDAHDPSNVTYGGIPVEFHPVLLDYAYWKLASFDDDQSSAQGQRYQELFEQGISKVRRYVNTKGGVRLPRARVGRRRFVPSHPSSDWRY